MGVFEIFRNVQYILAMRKYGESQKDHDNCAHTIFLQLCSHWLYGNLQIISGVFEKECIPPAPEAGCCVASTVFRASALGCAAPVSEGGGAPLWFGPCPTTTEIALSPRGMPRDLGESMARKLS